MSQILILLCAVASVIGPLALVVRKIVSNFEPENRSNTVARDVVAAVALLVGTLASQLAAAMLLASLGSVVVVVAAVLVFILGACVFRFGFEMPLGLSLGCSVLLGIVSYVLMLGAGVVLALLAAVHVALAIAAGLVLCVAPLVALVRIAAAQKRRAMYGY